MCGVYNVKLVKTIFHRCRIYLSFLHESSEKTHELACFLYVRLSPVLNFERTALHEIFTSSPPQIISNFGTNSVGTHACYIPHPILLHVFISRDPVFLSQTFKRCDETKSGRHMRNIYCIVHFCCIQMQHKVSALNSPHLDSQFVIIT